MVITYRGWGQYPLFYAHLRILVVPWTKTVDKVVKKFAKKRKFDINSGKKTCKNLSLCQFQSLETNFRQLRKIFLKMYILQLQSCVWFVETEWNEFDCRKLSKGMFQSSSADGEMMVKWVYAVKGVELCQLSMTRRCQCRDVMCGWGGRCRILADNNISR